MCSHFVCEWKLYTLDFFPSVVYNVWSQLLIFISQMCLQISLVTIFIFQSILLILNRMIVMYVRFFSKLLFCRPLQFSGDLCDLEHLPGKNI